MSRIPVHSDNEQYERIWNRLDQMCRKLDLIDEAIRGSKEGDSHKPGIQVRLDRLEQVGKRRGRVIWVVTATTITLILGALWRWITGAVGAGGSGR